MGMPRPLLLKGERDNQRQVIAMARRDNLHSHRKSRSRKPYSDRRSRIPRHVERNRERGHSGRRLFTAFSLARKRSLGGGRIMRNGRCNEYVKLFEHIGTPTIELLAHTSGLAESL